ncbi:MAG: cation:proton antiporter [Solirubrobacterales bacterium]
MTNTLMLDIVIVFTAALMGGYLADRLKQSPIIGYILGGILVGPYMFGLVNDTTLITEMSEIGVILLMFTIGIEFSLARLSQVKRVAILGGGLQVLGVVGLTVVIGGFLQLSGFESVFLGCALAISSTMIVTRTLSENGEANTLHSQIMLGILIVQDLAVILMVVMLPLLHNPDAGGAITILSALLKTAGFVFVTVFLAGKAFPVIMDWAARSSSNEVFLLLALSLGVGVAALAHYIGLSVSLGAFLAGLVISESEYTHEIMGKIMSFRDAFVVMFFVSVGMMVNPWMILSTGKIALAVMLVIIIGKTLIVFGVIKLFGYHNRVAFLCALSLLQTGEFSIVLAQIGLNGSMISSGLYDVILQTAILSILLTPFFMAAAPSLYLKLVHLGVFKEMPGEQIDEELLPHTRHVILCGFGRVGRLVGDALMKLEIPVVVVDYDYSAYRDLGEHGFAFVYGDASNEVVLEHVRPERAIMAILALPDVFSNQRAARNLRKVNPGLPIVARAHSFYEKEIMLEAGVHDVVMPETEAGLQMVWHLLLRLDLPREKMQAYVGYLFEHEYQRVLGMESTLNNGVGALRVGDFAVTANSPWAGKSLREAQIRETTGCSVVAIQRAGRETVMNPHSMERVEPGDRLVVIGSSEQLLRFSNVNKSPKVDFHCSQADLAKGGA